MRSAASSTDLARRGQPFHALAVAREDRHAELLLEFDDGLGDARLRGMQGPRRLGQAELVARRLAQEAELLQVHAELRNMEVRFYSAGLYARYPDLC